MTKSLSDPSNQQTCDLTVKKTVDLMVVGGGTAGMAAAICAALQGLKVTVFDASGEDFDKPCGEGLMPPAVLALNALGVSISESATFRGIVYVSPSGKKAEALFANNQSGLGVRRRVLRQALWTRARQLGVEIIDRRVTAIDESKDRVAIEGHEAPWVCLATGSRDGLLKTLGLHDKRTKKNRPSRTGLRRHVKIKPWSDFVEVYWSDDAELYVTPVGPELVNVAILSWKPIVFDEALKFFPEVAARLQGLVWDDSVSGVSPLAHRGRALLRGRIFLAGDAAGFLDAMTGEGNSLAMLSGIAVANSISAKCPSRYRIKWLKIVLAYWLITSVALKLSQPGKLRMIYLDVVIRFPIILRAGLKLLSRTAKPIQLTADLFS